MSEPTSVTGHMHARRMQVRAHSGESGHTAGRAKARRGWHRPRERGSWWEMRAARRTAVVGASTDASRWCCAPALPAAVGKARATPKINAASRNRRVVRERNIFVCSCVTESDTRGLGREWMMKQWFSKRSRRSAVTRDAPMRASALHVTSTQCWLAACGARETCGTQRRGAYSATQRASQSQERRCMRCHGRVRAPARARCPRGRVGRCTDSEVSRAFFCIRSRHLG